MDRRKEILDFTKKFEAIDWQSGHCYYFAVMLAARFDGDVAYNVADGHFCARIDGYYYDSLGLCFYSDKDGTTILWKDFPEYDSLQYERIIRDCIKI